MKIKTGVVSGYQCRFQFLPAYRDDFSSAGDRCHITCYNDNDTLRWIPASDSYNHPLSLCQGKNSNAFYYSNVLYPWF